VSLDPALGVVGAERVSLAQVAACQVGDLVRVHGDGAGEKLETHGNNDQFPRSDGDWMRLQAHDGRLHRTLAARARLLGAIRRHFDRRGFLEMEPPSIATCPGLETHLDAVGVDVAGGMGGRVERRYLVTSPEYHMKRLLVCGFERIYALGRAYRSGERGRQHNPEFTMLEWYRAGQRSGAIVRDARLLVQACAKVVGPRLGETPFDPRKRWLRLTIRQAIRRFAGFDPGLATDRTRVARRAQQAGLEVGPDDGIADILVRALAERVEPSLPRDRGVVLVDWPACMASLARRKPGAPHLAERFEIYLGGIEIANGFNELTDPVEQRARFEQDIAARRTLGLPVYPIDERFLAALSEGCPPAAGVALGVDRLLLVLLGLDDISDVLAFPFERA